MVAAPWRACLLLVSIVVAGMAGCLDGSSAKAVRDLTAPVERPRWNAGERVVYQPSYAADYVHTWDGAGSDYHVQDTVRPVAVEILNTSMTAFGDPIYLASVQSAEPRPDLRGPPPPDTRFFEFNPVGVQVYRQRDLASVDAYLFLSFACDAQDRCAYQVRDLRFGQEPEADHLPFPLTQGKTWTGNISTFWNVESFVGREEGMVLNANVTGRVDGLVSLETPLGRIDAVKVTLVQSPANVTRFLGEVRKEAARLGVNVTTLEYASTTITTIYYDPVRGREARTETEFRLDVDYVGTDSKGRPFERRTHGTARETLEMIDAKLEGGPERNLHYLSALISGGASPISPDEPVYGLTVDPVEARVNAAKGESATFRAVLNGTTSLPAGHTVTWSVRDGFGSERETAQGLEFQAKFTEPGIYSVYVEATSSDGQLVASDVATVAADYVATISPTCANVAAEPTLPGCAVVKLPVRPGIQSLDILGRPSSPAAAANTAELRLTDHLGRLTKGTPAGSGQQRITIQAFDDYIGIQDWNLQWYQTRAVAEAVALDVTLQYGFGAAAIPEPFETVSTDETGLQLLSAARAWDADRGFFHVE